MKLALYYIRPWHSDVAAHWNSLKLENNTDSWVPPSAAGAWPTTAPQVVVLIKPPWFSGPTQQRLAVRPGEPS